MSARKKAAASPPVRVCAGCGWPNDDPGLCTDCDREVARLAENVITSWASLGLFTSHEPGEVDRLVDVAFRVGQSFVRRHARLGLDDVALETAVPT